jgi:Ca2+-binding EF-hand superfamily protein
VVEAFDMKGDEFYKKIFEDNSKGNPTLSKTSFRELLINQNISEGCDDEAFERAFAAYDQDNDEEISCAEFVSFCIDALN